MRKSKTAVCEIAHCRNDAATYVSLRLKKKEFKKIDWHICSRHYAQIGLILLSTTPTRVITEDP